MSKLRTTLTTPQVLRLSEAQSEARASITDRYGRIDKTLEISANDNLRAELCALRQINHIDIVHADAAE
jgi:hypothetical protein